MNAQVIAIVDKLLSESPTPPVVVIQGDHGSAYSMELDDLTNLAVRERHSILSAILAPRDVVGELYPSMSSVNTFRAVFRGLFDADLPPVPDRSFFSWYDPVQAGVLGRLDAGEVVEVTDIVAGHD